jgi:succinate dehydrogenase / fumarate reductase membrane anchor subunit
VALVPLTIWFVWSLVALPSLDFLAVRSWLAAGWNPVWLSLLVIVVAWHSLLGVQVVIEDYIHAHAAKTVLLVVSIFFHVVVGAAGLFAVVKAALLGPDPS